MESEEEPPFGAGLPRHGWRDVARWWAFLALIWAPALLFLLIPVFAVAWPWWRSLWIWLPWSLVALAGLRWLGLNMRASDEEEPASSERAGRAPSIAVIGAGPVGLVALKELLAVGAEVECFERGDGIGGVYRFDPTRDGGAWPGTRLTTSPWVTAFGDAPPESSSSRHWFHDEYVDYLERYVDRFELRPYLRLGHEVEELERTDDGRWKLRVRDAAGELLERLFDRVAVCSGLNLAPAIPELEGADAFGGTIDHIARYKGPQPFADERVTIVGLGESAGDIAHELAGVARSVSLSARRGTFIVPRVNPRNGIANDYDTNRLRYSTPMALRNVYMRLRRLACAGAGDMDARARLRMAFLLASGAGPMSQPVTKSDDFLDDILEGRVRMRPAIERLGPGEVHFVGGDSEPADTVLLATGFRVSFPWLRWGEVTPRHPGEMFLNMLVPEWGASIAFLGFTRPALGSIPPCGELQARYFAQLVDGASEPSQEEMLEEIARAGVENARSFPSRERPNVLVNWIPFLDRVAARIGCRPSPLRLLRDPWLAWKVLSGPMTGAIYRLDGPGACPARARETIVSLPRGHDLDELLTLCLFHFYAFVARPVLRDPRLETSNEFV